MQKIEIKDRNNNTVETITVAQESVQSRSKGASVIHNAVVNYRANQRQGTHSTKTKGRVRGGGRKPYRQKHTGRARAGSNRSPLWKGGGTIFGPQPRDYSYKMPHKVRKVALKEAFNRKLLDGEVVIIDKLSFEKPKTKEMLEILKNLELTGKSVLIVLSEKDDTVALSARNIPAVHITRMSELNAYGLVAHQMILMTKDAVTQLEGMKSA
jgi:large subunit ribosomal protein L4